jgi:flagellar basal-body rod protein FlgF
LFDMSDGIYLGMNGATARLQQLDAVADNLANAETPGFRAARPVFETFLPIGDPRNAPSHVAAIATSADPRTGDAKVTGRPLDVRLDEGSWLTVVQPDQSLAYTRDGRMQLEQDGSLTIGGRPVLGSSGGALVVPFNSQVQIDERGGVLADGLLIDTLALAELSGPLERLAPTLVTAESAAPVLTPAGHVHTGELEGSNARALDSTVALVQAQRAYDQAMQAIQTARKLDERGVEVGRIRG